MTEYRTLMQYLKDSVPYPLLWDDKDKELNVIANREGWRVVSVSHLSERQRFVMFARETNDNP
jgi:hypothetical protein